MTSVTEALGGVDLVFGVLGDGPDAALFARLRAASLDSNPGLPVAGASCGGLRIGSASRATSIWAGRSPSIALCGRVATIDGGSLPAGGDTSVLGARLGELFERHGGGMWEHLDGSFLVAVEDGAALHLGVDAAGARSVYWWQDAALFAFHSHLLDLAAAIDAPLTPDLGAIAQFLACGSYPPGRTGFREIGHLGAGQCLELRGARVVVREHFGLASHEQDQRAPTEPLVHEAIERITASARRSWVSADRPVVPLSGGLDSRYLTAELVALAGSDAVRTITWGEERSRPRGDGVLAQRVAAELGVGNAWYEKPQLHTAASVERTLYLSSGEADCAIHFPDDVGLHAALTASGHGSLFRGDECFGATPRLLTDRAILAVNGIAVLDHRSGYAGLVPDDLLGAMRAEQAADLAGDLRALSSPTTTGRRDEIYYRHRLRRVLAPYNRVKLGDLEVFTPFLDRSLLSWLATIPDRLRWEKRLLELALARRFPRLARIPFATATNLPDWEWRAAWDPGLTGFWRMWCEQPGWLEEIGAREPVLAGLAALEAHAASTALYHPASRGGRDVRARAVPVAGRAWTAARAVAKRTLPGRLAQELTLERRFARNNLPRYLRLARLAVLHRLLAEPAVRRSRLATAAAGAVRAVGT